jgi:hypothetical protein
MSSKSPVLERLIDCLPRSFAFYHLGQVELRTEQARKILALSPGSAPLYPTTSSDRIAVAYSIEGDIRGLITLVFDQGLDVSTYAELGNIIASRVATDLENRHGLDVTVSPPRILRAAQVEELLNQDRPRLTRTYLHQHEGKVVPLQTLLMSSEGLRHA